VDNSGIPIQQTITTQQDTITTKWIHDIIEDAEGFLWLGTQQGAIQLDEKCHVKSWLMTPQTIRHSEGASAEKERRVTEESPAKKEGLALNQEILRSTSSALNDGFVIKCLASNEVYSIYQDSEGIFWLGTATGGLHRYDQATDEIEIFNEETGLSNNAIYGILPGVSDDLWLSSNYGLMRFNKTTHGVRTFLEEDGLTHYEYNRHSFFKSSDGRLWFGGVNGINVFDPTKFASGETDSTQMLISKLEQYIGATGAVEDLTSDLMQSDIIKLKHNDKYFTLHFALANYHSPKTNEFAFKIEGYEDEWNYLKNDNYLRINNLPRGKYNLLVRGKTKTGSWAAFPLSIPLRVYPPWWVTWWAILGYVIVGATGLFIFYKRRIRSLKIKEQRRIEQMEATKLKEMDELKSRFFANISHEFRTPLTLIQGPVEQMIKEAGEEKAKKKLEMVLRNSESLLRLVNQLLDLSKIESGEMQVKADKGDLIAFIRDLVAGFETQALEKQITLTFDTSAEVLESEFDKEKLEQIIYNLLSNAIKFTESGGMVATKIEYNRSPLADAPETMRGAGSELDSGGINAGDGFQSEIVNGQLSIVIRDSGSGIPASQLPHIFDRFYQVDTSATRRHQGTGIGLAVVKNLVEVLGGKIEVESAEGKGTAFSVTLPLNIPLSPPSKGDIAVTQSGSVEQQHRASAISPFEGGLRGMYDVEEIDKPSLKLPINKDKIPFSESSTRNPEPETYDESQITNQPIILVIEDNPDVREYIKSTLEKDYQIIEAANGKEGVKKAIEYMPDLILSDIMMPEMDGYEACEILKKDPRTGHIPIIMLTAKVGVENRIVGWRTGADDYLVKPFNTEELLARIDNLIRIRQVLQERYKRVADLPPDQITGDDPNEVFLQKVTTSIKENLSEPHFSLDALYEEVGMSRTQFYRKYQSLTGQSPAVFLKERRMDLALHLLQTTDFQVAEVCYESGFNNPDSFSRMFANHFGFPPSEARKG
jgi:signal transduction histidine kinase/DNA-binding response OmpR family regulator